MKKGLIFNVVLVVCLTAHLLPSTLADDDRPIANVADFMLKYYQNFLALCDSDEKLRALGEKIGMEYSMIKATCVEQFSADVGQRDPTKFLVTLISYRLQKEDNINAVCTDGQKLHDFADALSISFDEFKQACEWMMAIHN